MTSLRNQVLEWPGARGAPAAWWWCVCDVSHGKACRDRGLTVPVLPAETSLKDWHLSEGCKRNDSAERGASAGDSKKTALIMSES